MPPPLLPPPPSAARMTEGIASAAASAKISGIFFMVTSHGPNSEQGEKPRLLSRLGPYPPARSLVTKDLRPCGNNQPQARYCLTQESKILSAFAADT